MNCMKKLITTTLLAVSLFGANNAFAGIPVTCINCSNYVKQALDSITMSNELTTVIHSYQELITQTEKQIYMAEMEAQRLLSLPDNLMKQGYSEYLMNLSRTLDNLKMYKGDMAAMADIQRQLYPEMNDILGIVNSDDPNAVQNLWQEQMKSSDNLYAAALGISAEQLDSMGKSEQNRKNRIDDLLAQKNESQIQQAGNQLTGIMVNDVNELKMLASVTLQQESDKNLREQKQAEIDMAQHKKMTTINSRTLNEVKSPF